MKRLVAVGISIGVLAGLFTWFSFGELTHIGSWNSPLVVWVGFAAWACFYAVGGNVEGLVKAAGSTVSGLVWGWLIVEAWMHISSTSMAFLGLCVGIGAFGMCVQAAVPVLAFIPGAFVGAAAYFGYGGSLAFKGTGSIFASVLVSLVVGVVLAFASERGADAIERAMGLRAGDPAALGGSHTAPAGG